MLRRTVAAIAMIVATCGILTTFDGPRGGWAAHYGWPNTIGHPMEPQVHYVDQIICMNAQAPSPLNGTQNPFAFPSMESCDAWSLSPGQAIMSYSDTAAHRGNRVFTITEWMDEAFTRGTDAQIPDGTVIGETSAIMNFGCDDTDDYLVDSSSTPPLEWNFWDSGWVPEPLLEVTTAWGAGTGPGGLDEGFLDQLVPSGWTRDVRYRAVADFLVMGESTQVPLSNPISINAVGVTPPWGNARATMRIFGGDALAPSAQVELCLDGMLYNHTELNDAALLETPPAPGLYPVWVTFTSAPGTRDEQLQFFSYVTDCKHVGGYIPDQDVDCLPDAVDPSSHPDGDDDGLIDGVDLTWVGPEPCPSSGLPPNETTDCDGDSRIDGEEHFMNTNPRLPDSDGDGFTDSGWILDCVGDSDSDSGNYQGGGPPTNRKRVIFQVVDCKPNGTHTLVGNLGGVPWGNFGANEDNCPWIPGPQTNTTTTDPDLDALPTPGDTNGRFPGTADASHPDGRYWGDLCDIDDDNDGVPDDVEGTMYFDSSGANSRYCNTFGIGVPAVTMANVRDSDSDGSIDGVECNLGKNPADPASKPGTTMTAEQQAFFRLTRITQPYNPMIMDIDDGSLIAGVPEARGLGPEGASQVDYDRDGCVDEVEMVDVDGTLVAGDSDRLAIARAALGVSTFAPPGSITAEEKRAGDLDFNGVLGDPDRLGAARIVLTVSLPAVPDYNLNCKAATIGTDAN